MDQHGRYLNRGQTAKQGILRLFGADKSSVHANKVEINSDINKIAVRVAEEGSYRKIYRGSTLTNDEVAALVNAFDNMSLESNCTAAYFLLHGQGGNGYPPSFSTDRNITEPYAKTDLAKWPKHVNTVLITVKANGPESYHGNEFTGSLGGNTGALGVTTEQHPFGRRHEVVLDNRNTYHITDYRLRGNHLEVTMVASGDTARGRAAKRRAHDVADRALRPPVSNHRRTYSMPGSSGRPSIGVATDVRNIQHQARLEQARQAQARQAQLEQARQAQLEQARQAQLEQARQAQLEQARLAQIERTRQAQQAQAAQFAQAQRAPQWIQPPRAQPQYISHPPPPLTITNPRIAVVPPNQPYIVPPGWTAHVDHLGYTRFLPVQYVYYPAPPRKKGFFNKLFKG